MQLCFCTDVIKSMESAEYLKIPEVLNLHKELISTHFRKCWSKWGALIYKYIIINTICDVKLIWLRNISELWEINNKFAMRQFQALVKPLFSKACHSTSKMCGSLTPDFMTSFQRANINHKWGKNVIWFRWQHKKNGNSWHSH